mmetsp:Transcript_54384/g.132012  ORF Transcript_54384/g.132012 Transcript_54384/m.132012 type:complete len:301 (+) Transcript_54384:327-1229(+)
MDSEQTLTTIHAMRRQEDRGYTVDDYLARLPPPTAEVAPVDAACRLVMSNWCCEIASFCKYQRETVAIAMNLLDRWMSVDQQVLMDRTSYQLAAMTALYTAVKVHEQEAMDPNLVSSLSRGVHSPEAVEQMEKRMLSAVGWRVNVPTAMSYVRLIMDLVPDHCLDTMERETVQDIARYQIEQSMSEYDFCRVSQWALAMSSILNAVESVTADPAFYANFEATIYQAMAVQPQHTPALRDLRIALYELMDCNDASEGDAMVVESSSAAAAMTAADTTKMAAGTESTMENGFYNNSPRSVSA